MSLRFVPVRSIVGRFANPYTYTGRRLDTAKPDEPEPDEPDTLDFLTAKPDETSETRQPTFLGKMCGLGSVVLGATALEHR